MTETAIETKTIWERAAERFDIQAESIRKRWGPWVDQIPGATDPTICSDDDYVSLLISYGNATASATGKARPKVSNAWVAANKNRFADKIKGAAKAKDDDDVFDLVLDDFEPDNRPGALTLVQNQRRESAIETFEAAAANLALQQNHIANLNIYGYRGPSEGEKEAIALQNAAAAIHDLADINQRTARAVAAALGAASPNAQ